MSDTSKKDKEKAVMRRKILDAAHAIFKENGYDGLHIRSIAERIEYSPATIYLYYKDKNELFFALQYEAAAAKRDHLLPAANITDPWERLIAIGRLYIDFGMQHPDWYDLLFLTRAPMEHLENQECWTLGMATHAFFLDTVKACVEARYFKSTDADTIAFTLWCHAHGLVTLFVRERIRMYPEEKRDQLARDSFAMVVKMAESL